jgi:peptidoglycan/xylan/chitin deacetylase (PgdA/CDA1 family)
VKHPWVPILGYHRVLPARPAGDRLQVSVTTSRLETQMRWFARMGYRTISLDEAARSLEAGRAVPRRRFVVTFDDGYVDTLTHAVPVLERFGFTATVFVVTGLVGGTNRWDEGVAPAAPLMTWDQLSELLRRGFDVGSHTVTHPRLTRLPPGAARHELEESRRTLRERLGIDARTFCYPWGDWAPWVRDLVAEAGYRAACDDVGRTSNERLVLARADPTYWLAPLTPLLRSREAYFRVQRSPALRRLAAAIRSR